MVISCGVFPPGSGVTVVVASGQTILVAVDVLTVLSRYFWHYKPVCPMHQSRVLTESSPGPTVGRHSRQVRRRAAKPMPTAGEAPRRPLPPEFPIPQAIIRLATRHPAERSPQVARIVHCRAQ